MSSGSAMKEVTQPPLRSDDGVQEFGDRSNRRPCGRVEVVDVECGPTECELQGGSRCD